MNSLVQILVVEDDPIDTDFIKEMLKETGSMKFQIAAVSRLSEALAHLKTATPDLVLLDLGLPDSQGLQTFQYLHRATPHIPVVVLTGTDDQEMAVTAVREGAQDFLVKGQFNGNLLSRAAQYAVERKRAEDVLRDSEVKFRTLFENANDAIFLMLGDKFIDCNDRAMEMFGCQSRDQLVGHSPAEFSPPLQPHARDSRELAGKMISEAFSGQRKIFEWVHKKLDGTLFAAEVSLKAVQLGDKEILQAIVRDVTERKQAGEALEKKTAEMERFTYAVSHDLKSPLVTIKTFLAYLEEDTKTHQTEKIAKDIGYIRSAADKMGFLLEELLEFARAGHAVNQPEEVSLQEIVHEALALLAGQITERKVQVHVTRKPVWLYGDRSRLVATFQNLADNAVKFLGDKQRPRIDIGIDQIQGQNVIFVRDNGKGIAPHHQSKIFGLFSKLDDTATGSGIGLALVRSIVEAHGGKIWVQSEGLGKGTSFHFTLEKTRIG